MTGAEESAKLVHSYVKYIRLKFCHFFSSPLDDSVHGAELRTDDPDQVVHVTQDVDAEQCARHRQNVKIKLQKKRQKLMTLVRIFLHQALPDD